MTRKNINWLITAGISLFAIIAAAGCSVLAPSEREAQTLQLEGGLFRLSSELEGLGNIDVPDNRLAYPQERFGNPIVVALAYGAISLRDSLPPDRQPYRSVSQITAAVRAKMLSDMQRSPESITIVSVPVPSATLDLEITEVMEQVGLWQIAIFGLSRQPSSVGDLRPEDIVWAGLDVDYVNRAYQNGTRVLEASIWLEPLCASDNSIDACLDSDGDGIPDTVDSRIVAFPENRALTITTTIPANKAIISDIQFVEGLDSQAIAFGEGEAPELTVEATDALGQPIAIENENNPFALERIDNETFQVIVSAPDNLGLFYTYRVAISSALSGGSAASNRATIEYQLFALPSFMESSNGLAISIDENDDGTVEITDISFASGRLPAEDNPYQILGGNSDGIFSIDDNGALTASNWDYDISPPADRLRSVIVQGTDADGSVGTLTIDITLANIDDEAPVFGAIPTGVTVASGTTALSKPVTIAATDDFTTAANTGDPEAEISYAFVDDSDAPAQTLGDFTIDAATGVITVSNAPTFSLTATENTRTLTIRATDTSAGAAGETTTEETITIEVTALPIAAPANFTVAPGIVAGEIDLTWDIVIGALDFKIFRGTASGSLTEITPAAGLGGTATTYTDTGLTAGTEYFYQILAVTAAGDGARTAEMSATPAAAPAAPANFAVAPGDAVGEIDLTWDAVAGATGFKIFRGTVSGVLVDVTPVAGLPGTATSYTDTGITAGTEYFYQILAVTAAGDGARTAEASAAAPTIAAPANFAVAPGIVAGEIDLTWDAVDGATGFKIFRGMASGVLVDVTPVAGLPGTATSYTDTGITAGTEYFYQILAVTAVGDGTRTAEASAITIIPAPTGLTATASATVAGQIDLAWIAVPGADSYTIYRGTATGSLTALSITPAVTGTSHTDTGLANGDEFFYAIAAVIGGTTGPQSAEVSDTTLAFPGAPANFAVAPGDAAGEIDLTWDAVAAATGFRIFRGTASGTLTEITPATALAGTANTYTDTGLTAGTTYFYQILAVNAAGDGPSTAEMSAATAAAVATAPEAPANFAVAPGDAVGEIDLTWDAVAGATGFRIFRGTASGTLTEITPATALAGTANTYTDTALAAGTTYFYQILAVNAVGDGARAAEMSATPAAVPAAPTNFAVAPGDAVGEIDLTWDIVIGATGFRIFRGTVSGTLADVTPVAGVAGTATSYTDMGLTVGTTYFYQILAFNAAGDGARTAEMIAAAPITLDLESTAGVVIAIDESDDTPVNVTTISIATPGVTPAAVDPYTLAAGAPAGFAITDAGVLTAQLDYDALTPDQQTNGITITVQATGSVAGQTETIELTITVNNIDDEAPVIDPASIPTAAVTVAAGTTTLSDPIDIDAIDGDEAPVGNDAEISYAFVDGTNLVQTLDDFTINANTGVITVATAPTFAGDATDMRTLTIRATDTSAGAAGETTTEATITIEVTAPLTITPQTADGATSFTIDESDDTPVNVTTISIVATPGVTPAAVDPYTLAAGAPAGFAITDAGVLTARLDYEGLTDAQRNDGITITVQATGSVAGQTGIIELTITVNNIDDEAPVFAQTAPTAQVAGGATAGTEVIDIDATDGDEAPVGNDAEISYAIVDGDPGGNFAIDNDGIITVATAPVNTTLTIRATDTSAGVAGETTTEVYVIITVTENLVDIDGDGLIEIDTLDALNNIRHDRAGTSYKIDDSAGPGSTGGCPAAGCYGYELTRSLDFDDPASYANGMVNQDWRPNNANPVLATNQGWVPIGELGSVFSGDFYGNGHTITGLYSRRVDSGGVYVGLFGLTGGAAVIANVGLLDVDLHADGTEDGRIGALVGENRGLIVASYSKGAITVTNNGETTQYLGGLVGYQGTRGISTIIASYSEVVATVPMMSDVNIRSGGLIGYHSLEGPGGIHASYSNVDIRGNGYGVGLTMGGQNYLGGLIGEIHLSGINEDVTTNIVANYASGNVFVSAARTASVAGTGSFAGVFATGGLAVSTDGNSEAALGGGRNNYGFGALMYLDDSVVGGNPVPPNRVRVENLVTPPAGVTSPNDLTQANAGSSWNSTVNNTRGAWDYGDNTQAPALRYADYDGPGGLDYCAMFPDVICGTTLIPGQGR